MEEKINLKEIEKKAWLTSFTAGGIMDLTYGMLLVAFAIVPLIRSMFGYVYIIVLLTPAIAGTVLTKYVVQPRIGFVKFSEKRKKTRKNMIAIMILVNMVLVTLLYMTLTKSFPGILGQYFDGMAFMLVTGIGVIILFGVFAHLKSYRKMYLYGLLIGVGIPTAEFLYRVVGSPLDSLLAFGITGSVMFVYGLIEMIRFLKENPKPREA